MIAAHCCKITRQKYNFGQFVLIFYDENKMQTMTFISLYVGL